MLSSRKERKMRRRFAPIHCKSYSSVVTFSFSSSSHWYKLSLSFLPLKDLLMPLEKYHSNPWQQCSKKKPDWTVLKSPHVGRSVLQLFMSGSHVLLPKLDNAVWIPRQKLCKKTPPPRSSRHLGGVQISPAVSFPFQYENMGRRIEPHTRRRKMPHSHKSLSVLRVGI